MKAIVKFAAGSQGVACRDLPIPEPPAGWIRVRVYAAGICGTDLHIIDDEYPCNMPVTLGHEYVGTVDKLGGGVNSFAVGDTVLSLACVDVCGKCEFCQAGLLMLCPHRRSIGSGLDGAMAEYVIVPANRAFRLPQDPSYELALCEPLACCVRATKEIAKLRAGQMVFISGPGFIGQLILQLAKRAGATVVVSGIKGDEARLLQAKELGADIVCLGEEQISAALKALGISGFDVAFECAGVGASLQSCIQYSKKRGLIVQVGLFGRNVSCDLDAMLLKELTYKTTYGSNPETWNMMLDMMDEKPFVLSPFVSGVFGPEAFDEALACARDRNQYKAVLCFKTQKQEENG